MKFSRVVILLILVVYMLSIFFLSDRTGIEIDRLTDKAAQGIEDHISLPQEINLNDRIYSLDYNYIFSKITHFIIYFTLAILSFMVLTTFNAELNTGILISFIFCLLFASLDEYHQSFVVGRTSTVKDVIIDCFGALTFLAITVLIKKTRKKA